MAKYIVKRNGEKEIFNEEKITKALIKAFGAVGNTNWDKAREVSELVVEQLKKDLKKKTPNVEEVQDTVEKVLINNDMARIAKAYILYRKHRAEIRKDKAQILNKDYIDEVDKKFDLNALRVLASRYLRKNEDGEITESPKELFTRVSTHVGMASIFYDKKVYKKNGAKKPDYESEEFDCEKNEGKFSIGEYKLNKYHLEALKRVFDRMTRNGHMKVNWKKFLKILKDGGFDEYQKEIKEYYDVMVSRKFLPNTPAIANFGNVLGMGSACFVLGIEDDITDIMHKLTAAALIFKAGGGVGYNFSHLRQEGDFVKSTGGVASGPISFMSMYDNMTDVIKQGGIRRGANMGIMNSDHPDILKFIKAKEGNKALRNFNISVMLKGDFWDYYKDKKPYPLRNPRNNKVVAHIDPVQMFDLISYQAWESAEPGVLFFDNINKYNPMLESMGPIETTNPCGEVLLYPYESCNLGSINLWAFVDGKHEGRARINWGELEKTVKLATRFLDNVVDMNLYPLKEIEEGTLKTRKTGLGLMGLGDTLYELEVPYNSKKGHDLMSKIMETINYYSKVTSIELAKERGPMPGFKESFYKKGKLPFHGFEDKKSWNFDWNEISRQVKKGVRNAYTTVIAPTGSISMIAGTSSGVEPVFSAVFEKNVSVGSFYYIDPVFEKKMKMEGLMDEDFIHDVVKDNGSIAHLSYVPDKLKKVFVTAHDISPKDHVHALAAFQKWTDSSISKTNNFPANATVDDVKEVYLLAHKLKCKGVTIFRDGSLDSQVLSSGEKKKETPKKKPKNKEKDSSDMDIEKAHDEKADGLAVYKTTSISPNSSDDLGLSPMTNKEKNVSDELEDQIAFNGATSSCKVCNLE